MTILGFIKQLSPSKLWTSFIVTLPLSHN